MSLAPLIAAGTSLLLAATTAAARDAISEGQWFHSYLDTAQAHQVSLGEGIMLAIIDTGVDARHPDLVNSIASGVDLVQAGDGHIDTDGHGTIMAGLVAAHGRVKGIAPRSQLLPIRISKSNEAPISKLALGISHAVSRGADVISISRVSPNSDLLLRQQVEAALAADVVVVAGVGNKPEAQHVQYPAAIEGVVAVAGVGRDGERSDISVSGPEVVIAAPSDDISSTGLGGKYTVSSGTSDATAIVAGAVALVRARFPELTGPEVVRRLTATAIDKGAPGRDPEYGYGVLNLVGALTAELPAATASAPGSVGPSRETPIAGPSDVSRFPWWLLVGVPVVTLAVVGFVWLRRRRAIS